MVATNDFDVLIAGAGPAGAHLALRLARRGWTVGLLDAKRFPRKKPCGEFLSPECSTFLAELDLLAPLLDAGAVSVRGMHLHGADHVARGRFRSLGPFATPHGSGLGVRREVLDAQAVERAERTQGVRVLLGWRVGGPVLDGRGRCRGLVARTPEGAPVELRARLTVGADGVQSRVARGLGWTRESDLPDRYALVARFLGVPPREEAEVHVIGGDYFAACPIDDGLFTANLVVDRAALTKGRRSPAKLFDQRLARAPELARRLRQAEPMGPPRVCGPLSHRTRRCVGPGAALVGDASGFVDPLTGEGLYFAMRGAALLAEALHQALVDPARESRALARYARARRREFGPRYGLARLLQRGLPRPRVVAGVLGLLERHPSACDLLLGLTGDYLPPSGLLRPAVWRSARAHA